MADFLGSRSALKLELEITNELGGKSIISMVLLVYANVKWKYIPRLDIFFVFCHYQICNNDSISFYELQNSETLNQETVAPLYYFAMPLGI